MEAVDYKCPNCSAYLHFEPKTQGWNCDYCGSKFELKDLEANTEKFLNKQVKREIQEVHDGKQFQEDMNVYNCPDCGAAIIADSNTAATFCVYCKNTAILKERLSGSYAPLMLIPFKNIKSDAVEAFKRVCRGKILMPKEFKDPKNIQDITGIYIPFWLFDCTTNGSIDVTATKTSTWYLGNYMYTKTDTYQVKRGGEFVFDNIPVDGSIRFADEVMNSIEPFDYQGLLDFNPSYLSGFLAEKYDVEQEKAYGSAQKRAEETMYSQLLNSVNGYNTKIVNNKVSNTIKNEADYVLLPVWMLNIKYKDKMYTFAMNGQTGKMVGNIPYSKRKAAVCFLFVFMFTMLLFLLITYLI